ncbi:MAG: ATP F0F1 synthase subunit alpha [Mycoplasmatales bacterium]|nr:ATP F0F1 synthase subunit alpha [Mycoplasmatales bacterium]
MKIISIKDSIITIQGENGHYLNQRVIFENNIEGNVIKASSEKTLVLVDESKRININSKYKIYKGERTFSFNTNLFGKISDIFGNILFSEKKEIKGINYPQVKLDSKAPIFSERSPVNQPLETGIFPIDTLIPIGLGQRELIIGDRDTGKTSIALSTIINNKNKNLKVIYVSIGQKQSSINKIYKILTDHNAMKNVALIMAKPELKLSQYLSPYVGMAYAESLRMKNEDILIVFDDLSKHANIYREMSLNIDKPGGREAYPSDLFYAHSKLLEKSGKFIKKIGGGSITALPISETIDSDFSTLLSTNLISITDGQIVLDSSLAKDGSYPAINIGKSVSRTGSTVQNERIKEISKDLSTIYAKYIDARKYDLISLEITKEIKNILAKGEILMNSFKKLGYEGTPINDMYLISKIISWNIINDSNIDIKKLLFIASNDKTGKILLSNFYKSKNKNIYKEFFRDYLSSLLGKENKYKARKTPLEMEVKNG